ncbi:Uncharacterized protein TCM_038094 [Theobroma cacao]|uniref:Uncharacterized protein n=1 Tax=Theobroma cacao TaxID=3641 RepID=A0A061GNI1_THECC|nr:Uncharacterized protein TCM_038094 [Theobroma cacao]
MLADGIQPPASNMGIMRRLHPLSPPHTTIQLFFLPFIDDTFCHTPMTQSAPPSSINVQPPKESKHTTIK